MTPSNKKKKKLKLALGCAVLQHVLIPWVGIEYQVVDRVLRSTSEQIRVDFTIVAAQTAVELPVRELPGIDETNGMGPDLVQKLHHSVRLRQRDLAGGDGTGREELTGLTLESVQRVQAEELVHQGHSLRIQLGCQLGRSDRLVEVLDHEVLRVRGRQSPEVDQQAVP